MRAAPLRAVAGGALMARFFGSGRPDILALHGWGRDGADFGAALDSMTAMAPDLPGFGYSPAPDGVWGADGYARALAPALGEMRTPVLVIGHSFGGRVAVCLAARRPDLVRGLILTGAPLLRAAPPRPPRLSHRLLRWANRRGLVSDARLEARRRRSGSPDYRAARGVMRQVLVKVVNESYEQHMDILSTPVELIWGADDREAPVGRARAVSERLEKAGCPVDLRIIPGAGHDLPRSHPGALREAIARMREATRP